MKMSMPASEPGNGHTHNGTDPRNDPDFYEFKLWKEAKDRAEKESKSEADRRDRDRRVAKEVYRYGLERAEKAEKAGNKAALAATLVGGVLALTAAAIVGTVAMNREITRDPDKDE